MGRCSIEFGGQICQGVKEDYCILFNQMYCDNCEVPNEERTDDCWNDVIKDCVVSKCHLYIKEDE